MTIWLCLVLYVGVINFLTYATWAMDKKYAIHGARRVSERRLLGLCLLGGWPSALVSTYSLKHKSAKPSFLIKMYALITIQLCALGTVAYHMRNHPDALVEMVKSANLPHTAFVCAFDDKAFCL